MSRNKSRTSKQETSADQQMTEEDLAQKKFEEVLGEGFKHLVNMSQRADSVRLNKINMKFQKKYESEKGSLALSYEKAVKHFDFRSVNNLPIPLVDGLGYQKLALQELYHIVKDVDSDIGDCIFYLGAKQRFMVDYLHETEALVRDRILFMYERIKELNN